MEDVIMEDADVDEETVIEIDLNKEKGIEAWNRLEKELGKSEMVTQNKMNRNSEI